ncbi:MAG: ABC-type sugar transport system, ATPase component [Frankiales bacterium]|nr:ABC-type sugar transport system, ATPase component [Frankiales bacterium]
MSHVRVEGLGKTFPGKPPVTVVEDLDLEIEQGEFLVLLGPSGCGKTTTLRCLAGLESPTRGRISFADRVVLDAERGIEVAPNKRNIGMVFQSYALWPHMTVRKNIGYPLKVRGRKKELKDGWVEKTAELVDCGPLLDRYPAQLSGGQQQRVALARGLVAQPDLVLFDEPLSNLDARLRDSVRAELHELHQRLRYTAVFVTHDQSEALALGDRLAIMNKGKIEQYDVPQAVFERPATEYVAAFIGMSNRLVVARGHDGWTAAGAPLRGEPGDRHLQGDSGVLRLRSDDLVVARAGTRLPEGSTVLPARVVDAEYGGRHMDVVVSVGENRLHARVPCGGSDSWTRRLLRDDEVTVGFRTEDARFFADPAPAASLVDLEPERVEA